MEMRFPGENITGIQVYFLVYILRHHPQGTYITEVCREIGVAKSTLSELVRKLKDKGYLAFEKIRRISAGSGSFPPKSF